MAPGSRFGSRAFSSSPPGAILSCTAPIARKEPAQKLAAVFIVAVDLFIWRVAGPGLDRANHVCKGRLSIGSWKAVIMGHKNWLRKNHGFRLPFRPTGWALCP